MHPKIQGTMDAFFESMAAGWAKDVQKGSIAELPGMKTIPFEFGDYRVLDAYYTTPHSDKSTGMTTIWHNGVPVWVMYYGGEYAKIAMPFLKSCLHQAYVTERRFYGGRGPYFERDERFTYINQPVRESFKDFEGEEHIFDLTGQPLGHHWYRGMSLLKS